MRRHRRSETVPDRNVWASKSEHPRAPSESPGVPGAQGMVVDADVVERAVDVAYPFIPRKLG